MIYNCSEESRFCVDVEKTQPLGLISDRNRSPSYDRYEDGTRSRSRSISSQSRYSGRHSRSRSLSSGRRWTTPLMFITKTLIYAQTLTRSSPSAHLQILFPLIQLLDGFTERQSVECEQLPQSETLTMHYTQVKISPYQSFNLKSFFKNDSWLGKLHFLCVL